MWAMNSMASDDPLQQVYDEYQAVCEMLEQVGRGDRDAFFYQLRNHYSGMRYHLSLFHLACVRAFERFEPDQELQHSCLGAFYEYGSRPELVAFRRWFEAQRDHPNEVLRQCIPVLLEMCDLAQAEEDRRLLEGCNESGSSSS
jgi:hypothetical protein